MDEQSVRRMIYQGEGRDIEFKREFTTDLDRDIVAFANGTGGTILIGIADDASIVGITDTPQRIEERVMGLCRTNIKPPLTPSVGTIILDGHAVVLVQVVEGIQKPYTANDICYVRAGSTTRRARPEELRWLSLETDFAQFERTPVDGTILEDLDLAKLQNYVEQRAPGAITVNGLRLSDVAASWGLVRKSGEMSVPTVAGLMLFGLHPQWLRPQWGLGAIRLSGTELTDPIADRVDLEGTVEQLVDGALAFLRRNMRVAGLFDPDDPAKRRDVPEYPLAAVREAVTNAVVHRDYSTTSRIFLRMFEDRLEVVSPGGLPGNLTLEEVTQKGGTSLPRNPTIARTMREWGKMEEVGRGLLRIRREMETMGSAEPVFQADSSRFNVILPSRHSTIPELQRS